MSAYRPCGNLSGHEATMGITHGGGGILLSVIRLCEMGVTPEVALDMSKSLH